MEITIDAMAHGGDGVGRIDGKAHFVAGTMPGEVAEIDVTEDRGNFARARLLQISAPSPDRVEPLCPYFGTCGGCTWQYAAHAAQLRWKEETVRGQLQHIGKIDTPNVRPIVAPGLPFAYRNRMDFRVVGSRPALYRARSRTLVPIDRCLLLHPTLESLFDRLGPLDGVEALTIRTGTRTGDTLVLVTGALPPQADTWESNVARWEEESVVAISGPPSITEEVAGIKFRISAATFFQVNTDGADALVRLVGEALQPTSDDTLLDGYSGGGLFSATVGAKAGEVIAIESSRAAIADARRNLRVALPESNRILVGRFEEVVARVDDYWTIAVVDPPRTGLRREGVEAVIAAAPRAIAYVACDPASLGRDSKLLAGAGYRLDWATPVDLFPQTYHVEAVARFERT